MSNRRTFLGRALAAGAAFFAPGALPAQQTMPMQMHMPMPPDGPPSPPPPPPTRSVSPVKQAVPHAGSYTPVVTTDVGDLEYTMDGETKVFRLVAEVVRQKIHPSKTLDLWGFNGSAPGPTMQVHQGDHVRILFENHLPE